MTLPVNDSRVLALAMELSGVGCWLVDLVTGQLQSTAGNLRWLGYPDSFRIEDSETLRALIHPDDEAEVVGWFRSAFAGESTTESVEYRLKTGSGRWRWVQSRAVLLDQSPGGGSQTAVVTSRDITQQRLLQSAFEDVEARWTALVDEAPIGITIVGSAGQIQFANKLESSGHSVPIVGRQWIDFLPEELRPGVSSALLSALTERTEIAFQTYRVDSAGVKKYYDNHISPVANGGKTVAAMVVSLDVTQEHLSRRKQRKSARRNEILLSLHGGPLVGREACYRIAVLAIKELTDADNVWFYQVGTDEGLSVLRASTAMVDRAVPNEMDSEAVSEVWKSQKWQMRKADGENQLVLPADLIGFVPLVVVAISRGHVFTVDDCMEIQEFLTLLAQLVHRKEQALTLEKLSLAIDCTPVSILIVDQRGDVEYANRYFRDHSDGVLERAARTNLWSLLGAHWSLEVTHEIRDCMDQDLAWRGEVPLALEGARASTQFLTINPVRREVRGATHFVVVMEDVTERKASQELVYEAQKMETMGQIAAGVAHDFNNLLTSILAYNEMVLRRADQADSVRGYAEKIRRAGAKASQLVSGLLAAGRRQVLAKERTDLGLFLKNEAGLLDSLAKPHFRLEKGPSLVFVDIDPVQIGQVILNLVTNAKDALEEKGGEIVLQYGQRTFIDGEKAWIAIQDDGPGIPLEMQQKIFEPFFTTKKLGKGTGLGLAMVHGIVQQHGGRLVLESTLGVGTTFTVILPLANESPPN